MADREILRPRYPAKVVPIEEARAERERRIWNDEIDARWSPPADPGDGPRAA